MNGSDQVLMLPLLALFVIAVVSGVKWGFTRAAIVFVVGLFVLLALLAAAVTFYYANGGH